MEAYAAFVWADGVVMLYAVAHVVSDASVVVDPRHAESEYAVRYAQAFDKVIALEFGVLVIDILD